MSLGKVTDQFRYILTWTSFWTMAAACCCKGTWTTCSGVELVVDKGIAREAPATADILGKFIPEKYPMFASGRIPGTAIPAETNDSSGWSHFLLFLKKKKRNFFTIR